MAILKSAILTIFKICMTRLPRIINTAVGLNLPEKAMTKAAKRIITLNALQPSIIRATYSLR